MPAHRLPNAKAEVTGATQKNPKRFKQRSEPDPEVYGDAMSPLGDASDWLPEDAATAFDTLCRSFPWLTESSRISVEIAAMLYARMRDPKDKLVATDIAQLRALVGAFGGTPASLTNIAENLGVVSRMPHTEKPSTTGEGTARFFSS